MKTKQNNKETNTLVEKFKWRDPRECGNTWYLNVKKQNSKKKLNK